ncbi:MAG: mechanosensitive ion channel family protein [Chitinophagales bacterium]
MTYINLDFLNNYVRYGFRVLFILVLAYLFSRFLRYIVNRYFQRTDNRFHADQTKVNFFKNATSFIVFSGAITLVFYSIPALRSIGVTLFASAGIFAAILGFASQQAFSNIISGIFIVFFKPFRVGDTIKIGVDVFGTVEDITLRHTVIKSFENRRIVIPNSIISSETIVNSNLTDERMCNFIEFGISYDSDVDLAFKIICEEAMKHPNIIDGRSEEDKANGVPQIATRVMSYGDFTVNIRAYVWTQDFGKGFDLRTDLNKSVKARFDKEGIEIPFPYRTIVYKKDLPPNK